MSTALLLIDLDAACLARAISSVGDEITAVWDTYSLEDLLAAEPDSYGDLAKSFNLRDFSIPWVLGEARQAVPATCARVAGREAIEFMVGQCLREMSVIADGSAEEAGLIELVTDEYSGAGRYLDSWASTFVGRAMKCARWSVWDDLPCPDEKGDMRLVISGDPSFLDDLQDRIDRLAGHCTDSPGGAPYKSSAETVPRVVLVDAVECLQARGCRGSGLAS